MQLNNYLLKIFLMLSTMPCYSQSLVQYSFPQKTIIIQLPNNCITDVFDATFDLLSTFEKNILNTSIGKISYPNEQIFGNNIHLEILKENNIIQNYKTDSAQQIFAKLLPYVARNEVFYKLYVIENIAKPEMQNAFTIAGGNVYITWALLSSVGSNDELAGILAHEICHNENQHCAKALQQQGFADVFLPNDNTIKTTSTQLYKAITQSYNQSQELEADLGALYLAYSAGYNPAKYSDFFVRLESEKKQSYFEKFISTHPLHSLRIQCVAQYLLNNKIN